MEGSQKVIVDSLNSRTSNSESESGSEPVFTSESFSNTS